MKRTYIFFAAAMTVLAVGCQKNEIPSISEEAAEVALTATLPETKTTLLDGYKVAWTKNDQIAVFNAPTGTEEYSGNMRFYIDEEATGVFTAAENTTVPFEDGVSYDWYVCSPWRSTGGTAELQSPKGQTKEDGYFPIGTATQDGYNNSVHIASSDIMVGKATNTRTPVVHLKHLGVLHKFTVTNSSNAPTVITKLNFNGGENKIFGTFRIDMTADEPAIDVTKANATFNERALTVKNGTELAVGESADFYVMTAPFTLNAGETFKVTIETTTGSQVVEKTAASDIEFAAGTYNTANLVYDYVYVPVTADWLYYETFESESLANVSTNSADVFTNRWTTYDKIGLSVYDGDISAVKYTNAVNSTISRYVATSAIKGMDDLYVFFGDEKNGTPTIIVEGIKLHGYTKLNLSFLQTFKNSSITVEYSVDNGSNWTTIGTYTNPNTATCEERSIDFELLEVAETIYLRFTGKGKPRFDNIKLTWKE